MAAGWLIVVPVPDASAATVLVQPGARFTGGAVDYRAALGEQNAVVVSEVYFPPPTVGVTQALGLAVTIHDAGAVITPGAGCDAVDAHTAMCQTDREVPVKLDLGDGDDQLRPVLPPSGSGPTVDVAANGGLGDDVLDLRSSGSGTLDGGGGHDQLYGGAVSDVLTDGDLDGSADEAGPNADVLDGGPGEDVISYAQRKNPVSVDLARESAGEAGEADDIRGIESIVGGAGNDRLAGTDRANYIVGGPGHDTLIGRGGGDWFGEVLMGMFGDPLLPGTRGDDVSCGLGGGDVWYPTMSTYVTDACGRLFVHRTLPPSFGRHRVTPWGVSPYPWRARASLMYSVGCVDADDLEDDARWGAVRCSGTVTLRDSIQHRKLLAIGGLREETGLADGARVVSARLRVTSAGHRLAARARPVRAVMHIQGKNLPTASWTVRLKLPR